jgi:L-ribulose-5-phosphate 3-epimerase UlaE
MSEKLAQAAAKYAELVDTVQVLTKQLTEFRKITFDFDCVDFDEINEILDNMLGEIDAQLCEENFE